MGVDIGTTSTKAVLFSKKGDVVNRMAVDYPLHTPTPVVAEQDPDEIFGAVICAIRSCLAESGIPKVDFVSFSSAMHSLILVDVEGKPLTPSITWADQRSAHWADRIKEEWQGHEIYLRTGTPIHPMSPLAKLVWLKNEHPALFSKAAKFISIKEYVFHRLFGEYVIDYSIASATGLFHLEKLDWDEGALRLAGVTKEQLSQPVATTATFKGLTPKYAEKLGLPSNTSFVIGAGDGVLSNLGVNAIDPGVAAVTIGTSGAIRTVTDQPVTDPKGRIFCYALTDHHWVIGGPVNNGGMIFRWARDELAPMEAQMAKEIGKDPYDLLTEMASKVSPGSEGLIFHPYMSGERAPLWNAHARGSFFGLAMHHKKGHMIRAVLEGITMNLYSVLLALTELTGEPTKILATGGFARSELWRQMLADVFNKEVVIPKSFESSCLGAAVLGLYGSGQIDSLSAVKDMVGEVHAHQPNPQAVAVYEQIMPIFIRVSRLLEEEYSSISALQRSLTDTG
ncbi:gluconokinase [Kroppenstedtia sanguinis]